jgi:hypothetical protein
MEPPETPERFIDPVAQRAVVDPQITGDPGDRSPVPITSWTASALNCGLNLRRCPGMNRSSQ